MKFNGKAYDQLYPRQDPLPKDEVPVEDKMVVDEVEEVKQEVKSPVEVLDNGTRTIIEHPAE